MSVECAGDQTLRIIGREPGRLQPPLPSIENGFGAEKIKPCLSGQAGWENYKILSYLIAALPALAAREGDTNGVNTQPLPTPAAVAGGIAFAMFELRFIKSKVELKGY